MRILRIRIPNTATDRKDIGKRKIPHRHSLPIILTAVESSGRQLWTRGGEWDENSSIWCHGCQSQKLSHQTPSVIQGQIGYEASSLPSLSVFPDPVRSEQFWQRRIRFWNNPFTTGSDIFYIKNLYIYILKWTDSSLITYIFPKKFLYMLKSCCYPIQYVD